MTWQAPVYGWKRWINARGDSLVSSQCMHDDSLCAMIKMTQTENKKQETRQEHQGQIQAVQEATKLNVETRDPPASCHSLSIW